MQISELPFIDEHSVTIAAGVEDVWAALVDQVGSRMFAGRVAPTFARLVGADDRVASGPRPLTEGSTLPGFHVASEVPSSELVLQGHHRFSTYALSFHLERISPRRTRLRAETRAAFPGRAAGIYRLVVIGTGGHVVAVRRLLSEINRHVEAHTPAPR